MTPEAFNATAINNHTEAIQQSKTEKNNLVQHILQIYLSDVFQENINCFTQMLHPSKPVWMHLDEIISF